MPITQVVIIGGGFAGLRFFYRVAGMKDVRVTLIDDRDTSLVRPLMPEVAFADKPVAHARIPLRRLVERHGATFVKGRAVRIDAGRSLVELAGGERLGYDYLFAAVGAQHDYDAIPGFRDYGYSLCDDTEAPRLAEAFDQFTGGPVAIGSARSSFGDRVPVPKLASPCEGPVVEVMFMVDYELRRKGLRAQSPITVFSPGEIFVEDVGPRVHADLESMLEARQLSVQTSKVLKGIEPGRVLFEDGTSLDASLAIVLPPYKGCTLVQDSGLGDEAGFLPTDQTMRHLDHSNIYAAGDGTSLAMPKLGHIAIIQADIAAAAMRRAITGEGEVPPHRLEVFCIANQGGLDATLILSNTLYGGFTDLTLSGPIAHAMKWTFDSYYYHTHGHMPPDLLANGTEAFLRRFMQRQ